MTISKTFIDRKDYCLLKTKVLSITDSLFTTNKDTDLFYFIVFTKSMRGADGYYSEAVGEAAYKYLAEETEQFADYFNIAPKLTDEDLDLWVAYICSEIQISQENINQELLKHLKCSFLIMSKDQEKNILLS